MEFMMEDDVFSQAVVGNVEGNGGDASGVNNSNSGGVAPMIPATASAAGPTTDAGGPSQQQAAKPAVAGWWNQKPGKKSNETSTAPAAFTTTSAVAELVEDPIAATEIKSKGPSSDAAAAVEDVEMPETRVDSTGEKDIGSTPSSNKDNTPAATTTSGGQSSQEQEQPMAPPTRGSPRRKKLVAVKSVLTGTPKTRKYLPDRNPQSATSKASNASKGKSTKTTAKASKAIKAKPTQTKKSPKAGGTEERMIYEGVPTKPLEGGWPPGWIERTYSRISAGGKDSYFFPPTAQNMNDKASRQYKLRSIVEVKRYMAALQETGDEAQAYARRKG